VSDSDTTIPTPVKLGVIIASTRPGRVGFPVGQWVAEAAAAHGGLDVEILDLAEINLPLMDEPNHPRLRQYTHQHTIEWSARIAAQDAFVIVMPEYNYGFTAPLKNAIDYLFQEWQYKAVGLVSYGGLSGGLRAAQMIKQVLTTLKMVPLTEAVVLPMVFRSIEDGVFQPDESAHAQAATLFTELQRWTHALRVLREE
jgi:NAD(P)H-dependent FMN reductase